MRVVFMGTPDFAAVILERLLGSRHEVAGVFTQPDRPKGRGGKVSESPVKALAGKAGIEVFQPRRIRVDGVDALRALKPDVCVTAAFGQILSEEVLSVPRLGTVNVHASLLPRHRGASPVQWAILCGDETTGVTTMLTDKGIDTGDMLLKAEMPIEETDTAESLLCKLSHAGASLLIETLEGLERGDCPRVKQDEALATYDPMLTKEMGEIDLGRPRSECLRRVRAMIPWPCAFIRAGDSMLKVWEADKSDIETGGQPAGTVLRADKRDGLIVAASDGAVELNQIQAPNSKRMDARAFLAGHSIIAGRPIYEVRL